MQQKAFRYLSCITLMARYMLVPSGIQWLTLAIYISSWSVPVMTFRTPSTPMLHACRIAHLLWAESALFLEDLLFLVTQLLVNLGALGWCVAVCFCLRSGCQYMRHFKPPLGTLTGAVASFCESLSSLLRSLPDSLSRPSFSACASLLAIERSSSVR